MSGNTFQKGFTLLELLISIAIIGVIVLIISGALRLAHRSVESGERKIEEIERIRATLGVIDAQVQSALPLLQAEASEKKPFFSGGSESLSLATNYSLWGGEKGYVLVAYYIEIEDDGKQALHVSEQTYGIDNQQETTLLQACDEIHFFYFRHDLKGANEQWLEEWTDETKLPEKVMLVIRRGRTNISLTMPLRVQGQDDWISLQNTVVKKG